jgi:excisionase family DNA binding protein
MKKKTKKITKPQAEARNSDILTKREASLLIGVTPRYLDRQIRAGKLRASRPSFKLVRIRRADIDAWLDRHATA